MAKQVTVYSKPSCVQCTATTRQLNKLGIEYDTVDVSADDQALALVRSLGYQQAPVVLTTTGEHWSGFNPAKIKALAGELAAPKAA